MNSNYYGALNILRKEVSDDFIKNLADQGCASPSKSM
jgi:hypothetical protein